MQIPVEKQLAVVTGILKRVLKSHFSGKLHLPKEELQTIPETSLKIDSDHDGGLVLTVGEQPVGNRKRKWRETCGATLMHWFVTAETLSICAF